MLGALSQDLRPSLLRVLELRSEQRTFYVVRGISYLYANPWPNLIFGDYLNMYMCVQFTKYYLFLYCRYSLLYIVVQSSTNIQIHFNLSFELTSVFQRKVQKIFTIFPDFKIPKHHSEEQNMVCFYYLILESILSILWKKSTKQMKILDFCIFLDSESLVIRIMF